MNILGQDNILNLIDSLNIGNFPQTLMLIGPKGAGKKSIINYITSKFNIESSELDTSTIDDIYLQVNPHFYIVDINNITPKEQESLLKLVEEPPKNIFIIFTVDNVVNVLNTIINRCIIWTLNKYTEAQLKSFISNSNYDPYMLEIASTPGDILEMQDYNFNDIKELANKILLKMSKATLPNALSISSKLAFNDEKDKFNIRLFMLTLMNENLKIIKNSRDSIYYSTYNIINKYSNKQSFNKLNQKYLIENMIIDLWELNKA